MGNAAEMAGLMERIELVVLLRGTTGRMGSGAYQIRYPEGRNSGDTVVVNVDGFLMGTRMCAGGAVWTGGREGSRGGVS